MSSTAIPGYKQTATLTPYDANNALQAGSAFTVQIEDQSMLTEVDMDEIYNAASNGAYEGIQVQTKNSYEGTAVLDSADAFQLISQTQQGSKLWTQVAVKYSSVDANPLVFTAKGAIVECRKIGQIKKAWRVKIRLQINGYWTVGGAATGGVST